jgi:hypothetical protein
MTSYQTIANRFWDRYNINIAAYIEKIKWIGPTLASGFGFKPSTRRNWTHRDLILALDRTKKFRSDDKSNVFGAVAGSQHKGAESWREQGMPSLHCAIAPEECSCHIDAIGFVLTGPDGTPYYNPDLFDHIVHDLGWQSVVTKTWAKSPLLGEALSRIHPHVANSAGKYRKLAGIDLNLVDIKDRIGEDRYSLKIDFSESCIAGGPSQCRKIASEITLDFTMRLDLDKYLVPKSARHDWP